MVSRPLDKTPSNTELLSSQPACGKGDLENDKLGCTFSGSVSPVCCSSLLVHAPAVTMILLALKLVLSVSTVTTGPGMILVTLWLSRNTPP